MFLCSRRIFEVMDDSLSLAVPKVTDQPSLDKRSCLERAKEILDARDDLQLRYVCLELRFCSEAIAYDKLRVYLRRIPTEVLSKWQPPQLIQALLEHEPEADQSFVLRISPESSEGVPTGDWVTVGRHTALELGWLKKHYNKLGNLLHAVPPGAKIPDIQLNLGALRSYLQEVVTHRSRFGTQAQGRG